MIPNLRRGLEKASILLVERIKYNLSGESHVQYPGTSNPYPGKISGDLAKTIDYEISPAKYGRGLSSEVGANMSKAGAKKVYARIHEFGGYAGRGAYIPPRPYIRTSYKQIEDKIIKIIHKELLKPLRA